MYIVVTRNANGNTTNVTQCDSEVALDQIIANQLTGAAKLRVYEVTASYDIVRKIDYAKTDVKTYAHPACDCGQVSKSHP